MEFWCSVLLNVNMMPIRIKIFEKWDLKLRQIVLAHQRSDLLEFFLITFLYLLREEINEPTVKFPFSNRLIFGISTTGMDTSCKKRIHSFKCRRRKWPLHCLAFFALWSGGQEDVSKAKNGQFFLIRFLLKQCLSSRWS